MQVYNKNSLKELKKYLYNSDDIHDSEIINFIYSADNNKISVELLSPITKERKKLCFEDLKIVYLSAKIQLDVSSTVNSLTVEDDYSYLEESIRQLDKDIDNYIYLLFQMFSGVEIHIVSKALYIETYT